MSKRQREKDADSDDPETLIQLLGERLSLLSTEESDLNSRVTCFMEVLRCSREEAVFFLDSALGDIATAVNLCIESRATTSEESSDHRLRHRRPKQYNNVSSSSSSSEQRVHIRGLPSSWRTLLSSSEEVVFQRRRRHKESEAPLEFTVPEEVAPLLMEASLDNSLYRSSPSSSAPWGKPFLSLSSSSSSTSSGFACDYEEKLSAFKALLMDISDMELLLFLESAEWEISQVGLTFLSRIPSILFPSLCCLLGSQYLSRELPNHRAEESGLH